MSERQTKKFIERAVALYGKEILPRKIKGDIELQGMLEFMSSNNESYYFGKLARRIKGLEAYGVKSKTEETILE